MATEILLAKIGFSMNEGVLAEWLAADGDQAGYGAPKVAARRGMDPPTGG